MASEGLWPVPGEAPTTEDLSRCVHCGLCLSSCPTYLVTGLEVESPRGRIHFAKLIDEGRSGLTPAIARHWDLCLQCRACEAVCPSGVAYGRIQEHARAQLSGAAGGRVERRLRRLMLRNVIARPRVLATAMAPARWYSGSRVRGAVRRVRVLGLMGRLGAGERQLPARVGKPFRPGGLLAQPVEARERALLFSGCVMGELFGEVHRATGRVLARAGVAVEAPGGQECCGALHAHDGDLEFARKLARRNIAAFEGSDLPIVVNSAGCGAAMKEYGDLLSGDVKWAARATAFAARVKDPGEYLAEVGAGGPGRLTARVAYQDACHLAHAQGIREQPRELLRGIAGCELVETPGADVCCGAAGIYSLVQPEMSARLRSRKAEQFREARPDIVVTANPGCQMQYNAAVAEAGIDARVMHLMEVLDEAQAAAERDG
ncbi:MAG: (Fe-S)-binding protein [Dehalococcoidia bacterium]|nr:(Fe-S)-binding protein [Dehalococcoidia bacterium]